MGPYFGPSGAQRHPEKYLNPHPWIKLFPGQTQCFKKVAGINAQIISPSCQFSKIHYLSSVTEIIVQMIDNSCVGIVKLETTFRGQLT